MPSPKLRVVDVNQEHAREIAKRAIKERERERYPVTNIHAPEGAPTLLVDEVLRKAEPNHLGKKG